MNNNDEKIEDIDAIKMYKMVKELLKYDYYSTKCFVDVLLQKRENEQEKKNLENIQELLFYQKVNEVKKILNKLIDDAEK